MSPIARGVRSSLSAFATAAIATAALDVSLAAARAGEPTSARAFVTALAAALALYGVVGVVAGVAVGIVAGSIEASFPAGAAATLGAFRLRLSSDRDRDRRWAAGLLAAGAAAGVLAACVFVFARGFALEMANKRNGALSTAIVAAACVPVAAVAWFPLHRLLLPLVALLPRPRTVTALGAMVAVALLGVAAAVLSVDWRVLDFGPFYAAGAFGTLACLHLWFWRRGPGARLAAAPRIRRVAPVAVSALLVAAVAATLARFGDEPRSLALVGEETSGARSLLHAARRLADRDHDGYSPLLGGGDCNDRDPRVFPGAPETPGNGVDEDCSGADEPLVEAAPPPKPEPRATAADRFRWDGNVLVITIDTLRADRLNEKTMPHLAALAKQSVVFSNAYAQAPNTPRSFPSFLTSRIPSRVKWKHEFFNFSPITDENTTFFEVLHDAGLRTVGVFSHFYMTREHGIAQGFDEWDDAGALSIHDSNTDIASPRIVPRVVAKLGELAGGKRRFALWTHLFEPHSSYMTHPEFPIQGSGFAALEEKYDGEVAYTDLWLGKILDALKASGLDEKTAIVVFADHGESFGEHRFGGQQMYFHGETLYDEVLRVPLVVRVPGVTPRVVDERVMLIDLGPTLAELVHARVPPAFQGRSLLGALLGDPLEPRPAYAELLPCTAWNHAARVWIQGDRKLYAKTSENTVELYDLKADPREQHNLALGAAEAVAALKRELLAWVAAAARG